MDDVYGEVQKRLDRIYAKNNMTFVGGKKKVFIRSGLINYKIDSKNISCPCMQTNLKKAYFCDHLLFLLSNHYKLSDLSITFLANDDILKEFRELIKKGCSNFNGKIESMVKKYLDDTECGICLDELSSKKYNYKLFKCNECSNYVHSDCMDRWIRHNEGKNCIYCMTKNTNSLGF